MAGRGSSSSGRGAPSTPRRGEQHSSGSPEEQALSSSHRHLLSPSRATTRQEPQGSQGSFQGPSGEMSPSQAAPGRGYAGPSRRTFELGQGQPSRDSQQRSQGPLAGQYGTAASSPSRHQGHAGTPGPARGQGSPARPSGMSPPGRAPGYQSSTQRSSPRFRPSPPGPQLLAPPGTYWGVDEEAVEADGPGFRPTFQPAPHGTQQQPTTPRRTPQVVSQGTQTRHSPPSPAGPQSQSKALCRKSEQPPAQQGTGSQQTSPPARSHSAIWSVSQGRYVDAPGPEPDWGIKDKRQAGKVQPLNRFAGLQGWQPDPATLSLESESERIARERATREGPWTEGTVNHCRPPSIPLLRRTAPNSSSSPAVQRPTPRTPAATTKPTPKRPAASTPTQATPTTEEKGPACKRCNALHRKCDGAKPRCGTCTGMKKYTVCEYPADHERKKAGAPKRGDSKRELARKAAEEERRAQEGESRAAVEKKAGALGQKTGQASTSETQAQLRPEESCHSCLCDGQVCDRNAPICGYCARHGFVCRAFLEVGGGDMAWGSGDEEEDESDGPTYFYDLV